MIPTAVLMASLMVLQSSSRADESYHVDVRCGAYCLYIALDALKMAPATFEEFERNLGVPEEKGYSMLKLSEFAQKNGASTIAVETTLEILKERRRPFCCITVISHDHYVLLYDVDDDYAYVIDYPKQYSIPIDTFLADWNHSSLLIAPDPLASEESIMNAYGRRRLGWITLFFSVGLLGVLTMIGLLRRSQWIKGFIAKGSVFSAMLLTQFGCGAAGDRDVSGRPGEGRSGAGHLVVVNDNQQLGDIPLRKTDDVAKTSATLRNDGSSVLRILELGTNCTCTQATVGKTRLEPGESTTLRTTIRLGTTSERKSGRIRILTDSTSSPELNVTFHWRVLNPLHAAESVVHLKQIKPLEMLSMTVPILANPSSLCQKCILSTEANSDAILLSIVRQAVSFPTEHGEIRPDIEKIIGNLRISVTAGSEPNFFQGNIKLLIKCSNETKAQFDLPITRVVSPVIGISPERLWLGKGKPGSRLHGDVVLRSTKERPFHVVSLESNDLLVSMKMRDAEVSPFVQVIDLSVTVPDDAAVGARRGVVTFLTDDPEALRCELPVSFLVIPIEKRVVALSQ